MNNVIQQVTKEDIKLIAKIHKDIFKDHFLGMLPRYLIYRFYLQFINNDFIFLVNKNNDSILGFILGGYSSNINTAKKVYIKNNFVYLSFHILTSPRTYFLFLNALKAMIKNISKRENGTKGDDFRLLSIGTQNNLRGKGFAQELISAFEETSKMKGIHNYGLSVKKTNQRAIGFYKKCSFIIEKETEKAFYFRKMLEKL